MGIELKPIERDIFIIGSKGIPAAYGGYETFVDKLTSLHKNNGAIRYHVACKGKKQGVTSYNNARCFFVKVPNIGPAQAIYYDVAAIMASIKFIKKNHIQNPIIYILACRIGPFMGYLKKQIERLDGVMYVNPDGHEWKRAKWSIPVRKYWKISEKLMVKHSDLVICDSLCIEKYIKKNYAKFNPKTTYISYGAGFSSEGNSIDETFKKWISKNGLRENGYYLAVGRFVQENNYETMIREFMKSKSDKDFVIVATENDRYMNELENKLHFNKDSRIKFVGSVYDTILLEMIRGHAFAYIHGHEVGGTNPSLLEALSSTKLNLLFDVCFNREVGQDSAYYWTKEKNDLSKLINKADGLDESKIEEIGRKARQRIRDFYSWDAIALKYEKLWLSGN